jgi:hypothetical protein
MDGDLTSRNMNNGKGSNKDNPRFRNLKVNHKDNLRFSNPDNSNHKNDLRFNNHDTLSLKENLKERSIEVKKAERIEVREDTTIRPNDISQGLLLVEHLDGKRRGKGYLVFPLSFFYDVPDKVRYRIA